MPSHALPEYLPNPISIKGIGDSRIRMALGFEGDDIHAKGYTFWGLSGVCFGLRLLTKHYVPIVNFNEENHIHHCSYAHLLTSPKLGE